MAGLSRTNFDVGDVLCARIPNQVEVHKQRRQEGDEDEKQDQPRAQHGQPVAPEPMPGVLPQPDLLLRDLPVDCLLERRRCQGHGYASLTRGSMNTYVTSTTRFAMAMMIENRIVVPRIMG